MRLKRTECFPARAAVVVTTLLVTATAMADPLGDANEILCTVLDTHICVEAASCVEVLAEELNVPRFLQIDLRSKTLSTTEASGENRITVADSVARTEEQIALQGVEAGRAFSLFIDEASGLATFAAAAAGRSVSVFGVCTPTPVK